ncbi:MAG: inositol monophosphatase family protein [Woeseiaceae bacterium]
MHPMLNIAVRAARAGGDFISRYVDRVDSLNVTEKSRNDFVSEVDKGAEKAIIDVIRKSYPDHTILAEESGHHKGKGNDYEWIIDPLDGTTNFLRGFPQFAVSIAVKHKNRITQGVVYNPLSQELFSASRGDGAQLNGRRIRVTPRKSLEGALIGTGIPYREDHMHLLDDYLSMMKAIIPGTAGIRRPGSAALDLAFVAAGRFDGFWEMDLNIWDIAAGVLLVEEAGGLVGDLNGGMDYLKTGNIVAGNPKVFKGILQKIKPFVK